jgi:dihydropteroate synthase
MIKKMVGENMDDIIDASALYAALAARNGADILRVHDVKKTKQMLDNLKV